MSEFAGRKIAVIGLAATGLAAARILRAEGAAVTVYDSQPEEKLSPDRVAEARALGGVSLRLGTSAIDWEATDLVMPSPGVPRHAAPLVEAVDRGIEVMGEIEAAYRLAKAPILAITGTNGKTTTTALLGAICREAGLTTFVAGNIAEDAGVRLPLIEAAVQAPADAVIVAEISSFQLEWVTTFRPRVAAWLNVTNDHLDRHADFAEYAEAKSRLLRAQTEDDFAVLNADDENVVLFSEGIGNAQRRWFGTGANAHDLALLYAAYDEANDRLTVGEGAEGRETLLPRAEIPLPGRHNVANVLAAASMALSFGISIDAVRAGVRHFRGVAHRMENVGEVGGVRYVNNSMCTNPAAVRASLEAVGGPAIAIVGGRHKGGDLTPIVDALRQYARRVILIGEAAPTFATLLNGVGPAHETADSLPHAVSLAAAHAAPGDTVILAPGCASFDMFTGFEHRGQVFRDAVAALKEKE